MIGFMFATPKRHILGRNDVFCRILRQNPSRALGCIASCKNPPSKKKPEKLTRFWCAKSRMRRDETPGRIVTNLCTGVGVHDVITCADLYYDRLRDLGVAGGQILAFSIDLLRRPYNTLALPCECVMNTLLSPTKSLHFLNPATITFVNFAVFAHISTSKQPAPLPPPLSILNLITVTISITTF